MNQGGIGQANEPDYRPAVGGRHPGASGEWWVARV